MNSRATEWLNSRLLWLQKLEGYTVPSYKKRNDDQNVIRIDSNENLFLPRNFIASLCKQAASKFDTRVYPREEKAILLEKIGKYLKLPVDYITIGNGSNQLIDFIAQVFLGNGETGITVSPTFPMYKMRVEVAGARLIEIPLGKKFGIDSERVIKESDGAKLLFLCSPNNPTGNQHSIEDIEFLLENFPGLVVVDEAYVEFAEYSVASLTKKYLNLIVLRTFSKAFGLAGARLGYMTADPSISKLFASKVQYPYGVNTYSLMLGSKALDNKKIVSEAIRKLKVERKRLIDALSKLDEVEPYESQTNFVLAKVEGKAQKLQSELRDDNVLVRAPEPPSNQDFLRITLAPRSEMDSFLDALQRRLAS